MALVVACGSSSSNNGGDSGDAGDAGAGDDVSVSIPCNMAADGGPLCASGMDCCMPMFNLGGAAGGGGGLGGGGLPTLPMNSCVPTGSCTGTVIACNDGTNCSGGNVCCAGTATPEGGAEAGMATGIGALLGGGNPAALFATACQASCMPGQRQQCASSAECTDGLTCQAPNFGGGGGLFGGLGGEGGIASLIGGLLGGGGMTFALPMSCMAPPAEGGADGGSDSSTSPETGSQTDAQAEASETGSTPESGADETGSEASPQTEAGE
ncbi:MAG: hypothetical protein ACRENE_09065 [Polyangiaceae bacterium]